ncbi:S-adenosyl-L-methionine-dependent methyltransferase [Stemphylium lycopersici]|nr:S-adenosyl-L-methionine-dependent methyltransferase [Stemphylium lycopersici]
MLTMLGNAKTPGLTEDLDMTGLSAYRYNIALFVFFVPYTLFEVPSNLILKRLKSLTRLSLIMNAFVKSYPVKEHLAITQPDRVLFVDVGGGVGHQVPKFRERAPGIQGVCALLYLPGVLAQAAELPEGVVTVGHGFFDSHPESVKGTKAFYLLMVLHDWPEMQALILLKHVVAAMAEDGVALIHEVILSETEFVHLDATMDR